MTLRRTVRGMLATTWPAIWALALVFALTSVPSANASHIPPRFFTLMVPARDDAPQNTRLYATLGGVGNGNRIGDPVILATRAGLNPRQEWLVVDPRWPNEPEHVITSEGPFSGCKLLPLPHCPFKGPTPTVDARAKLVSRYSGKCLSISGVVGHGADITQQTCRETDPKQVWATSIHKVRTRFTVSPVYWYRSGELRCLGPENRSAGRQLAVHRRLRSTDLCPHWIVHNAVTGSNWRQPFTNPF